MKIKDVFYRFVGMLWMITYLVGSVALLGESSHTPTMMRFGYLAAGVLLLTFGLFGEPYPTNEEDKLPE